MHLIHDERNPASVASFAQIFSYLHQRIIELFFCSHLPGNPQSRVKTNLLDLGKRNATKSLVFDTIVRYFSRCNEAAFDVTSRRLVACYIANY